MTSHHQKVVHIKQSLETNLLSKAQKQFNSLIKKIESEKLLLQTWQVAIQEYAHKIATESEPLWQEYNAQRLQLAQLLDKHFDNKLFKKTDKQKIAHLICEITGELIVDNGHDELKPLFDKYSDDNFDEISQEEQAQAAEFIKSMAKNMFGLDIDDVDPSNPEQFQAQLKEKIAEHLEREQLGKADADEQLNQPKKSKKQLAKEAKQQQEEQTISQSIREVYRKLTSALHPDREQNPDERERKTLIMQKVNTAYAKKDLLTLLSLQLEAEQIDQTHLNNISEDRLKSFNKILKEQLSEVQTEINRVVYPLMHQFGPFGFNLSNPGILQKELQKEIVQIKADTSRIKGDLALFENPSNLKAWLKRYRIPSAPDFLFDDF